MSHDSAHKVQHAELTLGMQSKIFVSTANASKLIEKYFPDLKNIFLTEENIRKFFSKQENYQAEKIFCPF